MAQGDGTQQCTRQIFWRSGGFSLIKLRGRLLLGRGVILFLRVEQHFKKYCVVQCLNASLKRTEVIQKMSFGFGLFGFFFVTRLTLSILVKNDKSWQCLAGRYIKHHSCSTKVMKKCFIEFSYQEEQKKSNDVSKTCFKEDDTIFMRPNFLSVVLGCCFAID